MSFGLYIHIPYCLQKCHYCDFTTFDLNHKITPDEYTRLILKELRYRASDIKNKKITSIYYGGGTPSLLPASNILTIQKEIANVGFELSLDAEITIEINPGTIDDEKLDLYRAAGINRFSLGVQTFNSDSLKRCGREHTAEDSRKTLMFLKNNNLNYSFDLLFGLPNQQLNDLVADLAELGTYNPTHVSLYNLTLPPHHHMNHNRASDEVQAEMFTEVEAQLKIFGLFRYELSNFSKPGFESRHNNLYWSDSGYWGLGVSAHSYLPHDGPWGTRFWNATSSSLYVEQINSAIGISKLPAQQIEKLELHEALTDYCHTHLRVLRGLTLSNFEKKFGQTLLGLLNARSEPLLSEGFLLPTKTGFKLAPKSWPIANQIFLKFTFLEKEVSTSAR